MRTDLGKFTHQLLALFVYSFVYSLVTLSNHVYLYSKSFIETSISQFRIKFTKDIFGPIKIKCILSGGKKLFAEIKVE